MSAGTMTRITGSCTRDGMGQARVFFVSSIRPTVSSLQSQRRRETPDLGLSNPYSSGSRRRGLLSLGSSRRICKEEARHVAHLKTKDGDLVDASGAVVTLKGANWYGFNTPDQAMVQGLWQTQDALTCDFATIVERMRLLGFNAVRLSFDFQVLELGTDPFVRRQTNKIQPRELLQSVTPWDLASLDQNAVSAQLADLSSRLTTFGQGSMQTCADVPQGNVRDRFIWVVRYFAERGFYVIITDHLDKEHKNLTLHQSTPGSHDAWAIKWAALISAILQGPKPDVYADRVIADLVNEADSREYAPALGPGSWEFMKAYYFDAMDAIHHVSEKTLFFIEGTGQSQTYSQCWGDGFVTDPTIIRDKHISDANSFFGDLMGKRYIDNVVLSPHIYPPSNADSSGRRGAGFFGAEAMWERLTTSFGVLNKAGYGQHLFPICVGETGSYLGYDPNLRRNVDPEDKPVMEALAAFLRDEDGLSTKDRHRPIKSLLYWAWCNSFSTGDLVIEPQFRDINWRPIRWMQHAVGLQPWYHNLQPGASNSNTASYWSWE